MGCVCPELCISGNLLSHVVFYHQRHFTLHMVRFRFKHWWRFIHPKSRHGMRERMRTACKAQLRAQVSWKFTVLQSLWEKTKPDIVTASFSPLWLDRARYLIFKVMAVGCKMQIFDGGRVLMSKCKNSEKSVQKKYNRGKRIDMSHQGPRGTWWQGRGKPRARG